VTCETIRTFFAFLRFFFKIEKHDFLPFFGVAAHVFSNAGWCVF